MREPNRLYDMHRARPEAKITVIRFFLKDLSGRISR